MSSKSKKSFAFFNTFIKIIFLDKTLIFSLIFFNKCEESVEILVFPSAKQLVVGQFFGVCAIHKRALKPLLLLADSKYQARRLQVASRNYSLG